MTQTPDDDLRARLRAADPAADLPAADPDEVDRLVRRVVDSDLRQTGTRGRNRLTWLVAAAAVLVLAVGGVLWLRELGTGHTDGGMLADPGTTTTSAGAPGLTVAPAGTGRCAVPTPQLVAAQPVAFAGTVVGVADGVVTLRTTKVYAGDVGEEVTVTGAVASGTAGQVEGDPAFETGKDYLVAADDSGRVLGCGVSGVADPALRQLYDQAFAR